MVTESRMMDAFVGLVTGVYENRSPSLSTYSMGFTMVIGTLTVISASPEMYPVKDASRETR